MEENKNPLEGENQNAPKQQPVQPQRPVQDQFFGAVNDQSEEDLETILKVVSVCIPIVGAVLYFMNKDKAPKKAKSACTFALIGVGVNIVISILYTILGAAAAAGSY